MGACVGHAANTASSTKKPLGRPTKMRRKELNEPQITTKLTEKEVEMKCSKYKKFGHNKRNCRGEVGQNLLVTRHTVGVHNQVAAPTLQKATQTHQEVAR
ncbi:hypothetical protein Gogos_001015 [Gossypium gossypioides]|uniref:Uncharacterized protein n=1 Tax=Gossypium gossypioides TaxID=34282 RepID=A0A7J9CUN7_GOSGO|nr:hypothetical protein [Gossypium gossypioides]